MRTDVLAQAPAWSLRPHLWKDLWKDLWKESKTPIEQVRVLLALAEAKRAMPRHGEDEGL